MSERCRVCGEDNVAVLEQHHVLPKRYGGNDSKDNITTLCANCHKAIESIYDDTFFQDLGFDPQRRNTSVNMQQLADYANDFLNEYTERDTNSHVKIDKLYNEFLRFIKKTDIKNKPHKSQFGKALRAAHPLNIEAKQLRINGEQTRVYNNLKLIND